MWTFSRERHVGMPPRTVRCMQNARMPPTGLFPGCVEEMFFGFDESPFGFNTMEAARIEALQKRQEAKELRKMLVIACKEGDLKLAKRCICNGASENSQDREGKTALMWASQSGNLELVKFLVNSGAQVNARTKTGGGTALMWACEFGHISIAKLLIKCSADVNLGMHINATPLIMASQSGCIDAITCLIKHGANINVQEMGGGRSALMLACSHGYFEVVNILLKHRAEVNLQDKRGFTALWHACMSNVLDIVTLLLQNNANLCLRDQYGRQLHEVQSNKNPNSPITKLLLFIRGSIVSDFLLKQLKLSQRVPVAFYQQHVLTVKDCERLDHEDLQTLGVKSMKDRLAFLRRFNPTSEAAQTKSFSTTTSGSEENVSTYTPGTTLVAVKTFSGELNVTKGTRLRALKRSDDNWIIAEIEASKQRGMIPVSYVVTEEEFANDSENQDKVGHSDQSDARNSTGERSDDDDSAQAKARQPSTSGGFRVGKARRRLYLGFCTRQSNDKAPSPFSPEHSPFTSETPPCSPNTKANQGAESSDKNFDVFLSHAWGEDAKTHKLVKRVKDTLEEKHLITCWFDEDQITHGDVKQAMADGISKSKASIIFVTRQYMEKVNMNPGSQDNCCLEFNYITKLHSVAMMIPVVLESEMKNQNLWDGVFGMTWGSPLYVDMTKGGKEIEVRRLVTMIQNVLQSAITS